jgi:methionine-rich copper-binding protein CopC
MKRFSLWLGATSFLLSLMAQAHTHLEKAIPADGTVLDAAPSHLTLEFTSEALLTAVSLRKGNEPPQDLAPLPANPARQATVTLPPLTPGTYVIAYQVRSHDGNVLKGELHFSISATHSGSSPAHS